MPSQFVAKENLSTGEGCGWYHWRSRPVGFGAITLSSYHLRYQDVHLTFEGKPVVALYAFLDRGHETGGDAYAQFSARVRGRVQNQTGVEVSLWSLPTTAFSTQSFSRDRVVRFPRVSIPNDSAVEIQLQAYRGFATAEQSPGDSCVGPLRPWRVDSEFVLELVGSLGQV